MRERIYMWSTLCIVAGLVLLLIIVVYVMHAVERSRNARWVVDTLMAEYNYTVDLARDIVLQVDTLTRCKELRTDKESFMRLVRQHIFKLTGDEPNLDK